ncbi:MULTISPECIES: ABC transporter ATP-binding protein [Rhizobium/Agrobacterium group]|uniref:sn-glycerol-3-phosphate ABC transporter ATP-binding protein UgpC n=2 Tax=Agrobacterium TaxID=357 RepID=A0A546XJA5_AGRTU|nr:MULTISPECIES: sn-glycerol-3-phosphate ABC transporter ATP-binding protein UgpC [Rhizobium/Agrobacterium group]MCZ7472422.1 sn-glycerol-3-phosphate ABC transporter ATP-binding protein UgpC [Rhizobium rhizogenes]MCZ7483733.1 sn-glycerol-3-phosphate ABC transporter ATP-binding protein UgpC [Rhizobium rhizogenes]MEB3046213.1 sn-glycerol-3-phosphate ABC transporter ATP-binding protein UgpC [Rhizobium sp. MJ21]TRB00836.1 sn-glycerol-3-phosphate ABC transporter ATP-binding protein UgpC [Agrobacteri
MAQVEVVRLAKSFGTVDIIRDLDLSIANGEFVVLVGPSGCGKTTLLRMIAGLETTTAGAIRIGDRDVTNLSPRNRDIAMVFQSYALYPHMTAAENMGFSLKLAKVPQAEINEQVNRAAKMLHIEHLLARKPRDLSGGQRQRVAMGRAMVREPAVYLFDEPLSNLDAQLRTTMRAEIKRMHLEEKQTVIYVTHDQIEAMTLADRIVAMRGGSIEQIGSPDDLYNRPATTFVAKFIGSPAMNLLPAKIKDGLISVDGALSFPLPAAFANLKEERGREVLLGVRPEAFHLEARRSDWPTFTITASLIEPCGAEVYVIGDLADREVTLRLQPGTAPERGEVRSFYIDIGAVHLFDAKTERSLRHVGDTP